jgi:hypothetical protein
MKYLLLALACIAMLSSCHRDASSNLASTSLIGHWSGSSFTGTFQYPNQVEYDSTLSITSRGISWDFLPNGTYTYISGSTVTAGTYLNENNAIIIQPSTSQYSDSISIIKLNSNTLVLNYIIPWGGCQGPCNWIGNVTYTK